MSSRDVTEEMFGMLPVTSTIVVRDTTEPREASGYWSKAYLSRKTHIPRTKSVWKDEIEAIATQLANAKAMYNALSPIYTMPNEVLAYIFEILAYTNGYRTEGCKWGWVSISHVSQRFRSVAIGHASLWTNLLLDKQSFPFDVFLVRSRRLLLEVRGEFEDQDLISGHWSAVPGHWSTVFVNPVFDNLARMRLLDLQHGTIDSSNARDWLQLLHEPAPELRELNLKFIASLYLDIDPDFIRDRAPKLQTLSLTGLQMSWNINSSLFLRSVRLINAEKGDGSSPFTFKNVLHCMQNLPCLEHLYLWKSLPAAKEDLSDTRASLSYLRDLYLTDCDARCLVLWSSLNLPPTCIIHVTLLDRIGDGETIRLSACLQGHFMRSDCPTYRRVMVAGDSEDDYPYSLYPNDAIHFAIHTMPGDGRDVERNGMSPPGEREDGPSTIRFSFPGHYETDFVCSLMALIPAEPVQTLSISDRILALGIDHEQLVTKALGHFNAIDALSVSGMVDDPESELIKAFGECLLRQCQRQLSERDSATSFLPRLDTLYLEAFPFRNKAERARGPRLVDIMATFLQSRAAAGIPIRTLDLSHSDIGRGRVQTWQSWVEDVSWMESYAYDSAPELSEETTTQDGTGSWQDTWEDDADSSDEDL
ncbi:hypothetical protein PENSPDRAFT_755439 [Peniophora sp. CONT]|nr:hypothetical protein PENSPDRAFT_755439 [Peniophora sp. CONT]